MNVVSDTASKSVRVDIFAVEVHLVWYVVAFVPRYSNEARYVGRLLGTRLVRLLLFSDSSLSGVTVLDAYTTLIS